MKRFLYIRTSDHNNFYLYDRIEKRLLFVHPILYKIIMLCLMNKLSVDDSVEEYYKLLAEYTIEDIRYYKNKYEYWLSSGLYQCDQEYIVNYSLKMNPMDIKRQLANISQIVFEVTDRCNLKCYYCGYGQLYDFYDIRSGSALDKEKAFRLIDYMCELWNSAVYTSIKKKYILAFMVVNH